MSATLPIISETTKKIEDGDFDLVEMLLTEQHSLTAVERFSSFHSETSHAPAQERYYQDLLPATPPKPGQQYAFRVDLDVCSGCKACVVACHTLNGLEEQETWRSVGTVTQESGTSARIQHVTTACHHCEDPGCLSGCPVKAYSKEPDTGIVRHHDDQCIGCKYCTMMCPYEVPKYSDRLGIVRKCDMCHQRLSVGEAPACVQSCPNEAISIQLVDVPDASIDATSRLITGAPKSSLTKPTTQYVTRHTESLHDAAPQDREVDEVAESHWPLAVMLGMTQISVGRLLVERLFAGLFWIAGQGMPEEVTRTNTLASFVVALLGLQIASLHLGQPLRAWRVFLGLKTSWLSREAVLFGKYAAFVGIAVALLWMPFYVDYVPDAVQLPSWASTLCLGLAVLFGVAGLYSSAMIYIATQRELWRLDRTLVRFFGTAVVGGFAFAAPWMLYGGAVTPAVFVALFLMLGTACGKLGWEWRKSLAPSNECDDEFDRRSRRLIQGELRMNRTQRLLSGAVSIALTALCLVSLPFASSSLVFGLAFAASITFLIGEVFERLLYFSSVVYDRMPGILR